MRTTAWIVQPQGSGGGERWRRGATAARAVRPAHADTAALGSREMSASMARMSDETTRADQGSVDGAVERHRQPVLTVAHHPDPRVLGRRYVLRNGQPLMLGRASDVFGKGALDQPLVSREHVEVERRDDLVTVRDCGSRNGTFVDGQRFEVGPIHPGALLGFGKVVRSQLRWRAVVDVDEHDDLVTFGKASYRVAVHDQRLAAKPHRRVTCVRVDGGRAAALNACQARAGLRLAEQGGDAWHGIAALIEWHPCHDHREQLLPTGRGQREPTVARDALPAIDHRAFHQAGVAIGRHVDQVHVTRRRRGHPQREPITGVQGMMQRVVFGAGLRVGHEGQCDPVRVGGGSRLRQLALIDVVVAARRGTTCCHEPNSDDDRGAFHTA